MIPGSTDPEHIRQDMDIFDFNLSSDEMEEIAQIDRNEKHDWY